MNETFDPVTLIMIAVAVVIFFKLRGVLGQKTGHQEPFDPFERRSEENRDQPASDKQGEVNDDNVVQMPGTKTSNQEHEEEETPVWEGVAEKDSKIATVLEQVRSLDATFAASQFIDGAKAAYEMIVTGFAAGDKKALKSLLSKEVFAGFSAAIDERKKQGMEMTTQFIAIDEAELVNAELEGKKALMTIRFISEMVSMVRDKSGEIVEGDATETQIITDIWTFERNMISRDPNWRLVATDGDDT
ncbi:MAG: Tim44/TimA family putative adaptor protein [Devosiaceae bacterium]|nr:Tim44/TimA family putative adaptor protein [Devosiaceae bacterium]